MSAADLIGVSAALLISAYLIFALLRGERL